MRNRIILLSLVAGITIFVFIFYATRNSSSIRYQSLSQDQSTTKSSFENQDMIGTNYTDLRNGETEKHSVRESTKNKAILPAGEIGTANWKSYSNKEYGFEFKYPETGWSVHNNLKTQITLEHEKGQLIFIRIIPNPNRLDTNAFVKQMLEENEPDEYCGTSITATDGMQIEIDGLSGLKFGPYCLNDSSLYISKKSAVFAFSSIGAASVFDNVISTLHFR